LRLIHDRGMMESAATTKPLFIDARRGIALDSEGHVLRAVIVDPTADFQVPQFKALLPEGSLDQDERECHALVAKEVYVKLSYAEEMRQTTRREQFKRLVALTEEIGGYELEDAGLHPSRH
jgi:hypothetical protein